MTPFPVLSTTILTEPIDNPGPHPVRYAIPTFFQVSPTQVALLANRRVTNMRVVDHENGWDIFIFDSLDQLKPQNAQPGVRNHMQRHPVTDVEYEMVNHLPLGGFVPLGAKLPDGSPHPHAGTGFGMNVIKAHPADHKNPVPHVDGPNDIGYLALFQYKFDGQKLITLSQEKIDVNNFFPGWVMGWRGLSHALPDGEDLLVVHNAGIIDHHVEAYFAALKSSGQKPLPNSTGPLGACNGTAFSRWRKGPQGWRPVEMHRVTEPGPDMGFEPTLVRDADGSLLCSIRGKGANVPPGERDATGMQNNYESFRLYRSIDNGVTWKSHLSIHSIRSASPVTLNKLGDGTLFIAGCPTSPIKKDSKGRTIPLVMYRERLWAWPLTPDRTNVQSPQCILDAVEKFGPARPLDTHCCDSHWHLDHPLAGAFRLGDGQWHNLLAFRVSDGATNSGGASAAPQSGLYMLEIPGQLTTDAPWRF